MPKNPTLETLEVLNCLKTIESGRKGILMHFKQIFKALNVLLMHKIENVSWEGVCRRVLTNHRKISLEFDFGVKDNQKDI